MNSQELTLLYVFNAIMLEGSITRAADQLAMTQPAVSNAVARMRDRWSDPLFIKKGRAIVPTAFALSLWEQVREPLNALNQALSTEHFDAALSQRKFRISLDDLLAQIIWPPLVKQLAQEAPAMDLYAVPFNRSTAISGLREALVDLVIGPLIEEDHSIRSHWLFDTGYLLAMRKDHPLANRTLELDDYLQAKHLVITSSGDVTGVVDQALQKQGLTRRVAATANQFGLVPQLLADSDLVAVVPEMVAKHVLQDYWLIKPPIDIETTSVYLLWHARHERDVGLMWMRAKLEQVLKMRQQDSARLLKAKAQD